MSETITGVSMLEAFKIAPQTVSADELGYLQLADRSEEARQKEYQLLNAVWESEPDSFEEQSNARKAAVGYLVLTAERLHWAAPDRRQTYSDHLTKSSEEIYGTPDEVRASEAALIQYGKLKPYIGDPSVDQQRLGRVISYLTAPMGGQIPEVLPREFPEARMAMAAVLDHQFGQALAVFDAAVASGLALRPETVAHLYDQAIAELSLSEIGWLGWRTELASGSIVSTDDRKKLFKIGQDRDTYEAHRLKPVFSHEALVHGLRAVNGSKTGEPKLEHGLPGNLDAEEGLASFIESSVSGHVSNRFYDRYIDIAAALGKLGQPAISRREMYALYLDRSIVRKQIAGQPVDYEQLAKDAWEVNRIYRGSLGSDIIGVNTKDVVYYQGFLLIGEYISQKLSEGANANELFRFLTAGKFNPTDPRHIDFLMRHPPLR